MAAMHVVEEYKETQLSKTNENRADMFTKALARGPFEGLRETLLVPQGSREPADAQRDYADAYLATEEPVSVLLSQERELATRAVVQQGWEANRMTY